MGESRHVLRARILGLAAVGLGNRPLERPGGIFVRSLEQIADEDRTLFLTVARGTLSDSGGTLAEQLDRPIPRHGGCRAWSPPGSARRRPRCLRAIRLGLARVGSRGLPLMGSGDWNDGLNRVGIGGQGESGWLGFSLCEVLRQFAALARGHGARTAASTPTAPSGPPWPSPPWASDTASGS